MEHDPHAGFILAAYGIATIVVVTMIVTILADYRGLRRRLARFAAREADRE